MGKTKRIVPLLLPLAIALVAWVAPQAAEEDVHPDVDADIPCDVCHAEMTPEVHQEWYAGRHGKNSVKCFVCHGSIGDDFTKTPPRFRCISCHADQVATIEKQAVPPSCFDCHPPHLLSPHVEGGDK